MLGASWWPAITTTYPSIYACFLALSENSFVTHLYTQSNHKSSGRSKRFSTILTKEDLESILLAVIKYLLLYFPASFI